MLDMCSNMLKGHYISAKSETQNTVCTGQKGYTQEDVTGTKTQLNKNKFSCSTTLT